MMKNSDDEVGLMSIQNNEDDSSAGVNFLVYISQSIFVFWDIFSRYPVM
jgi:hypothetical protein